MGTTGTSPFALWASWLPSGNSDSHTLPALELSVSEIRTKQGWAQSSETEPQILSALAVGLGYSVSMGKLRLVSSRL